VHAEFGRCQFLDSDKRLNIPYIDPVSTLTWLGTTEEDRADEPTGLEDLLKHGEYGERQRFDDSG
jgi:hypothetical protein